MTLLICRQTWELFQAGHACFQGSQGDGLQVRET